MWRSCFMEEQIVGILKAYGAGVLVSGLCRKDGCSNAGICKSHARFGGMNVSEAKRLGALDDKNATLDGSINATP